MKRLLILLLFAVPVFAAPNPEPLPAPFRSVRLMPQIVVGVGTAQRFQSTPTDLAKCAPGDVEYNTGSSKFRGCTPANTWSDLGGGGSGTVGSCATTNAIAIYTASTTTGCGNADFTYATDTLTGAGSGAFVMTSNGAASFSPVLFSGTPFSGGNTTTTFPLIRIDSGTAVTSWNTGGTILGLNGPSGFVGLLIDAHANGSTSVFSITSTGSVTANGSISAPNGSVQVGSRTTSATYFTGSNCIANGTAASPSVVTCGSAASGMFSCATNASTATCQVNTSAVSANSEIQIVQDSADGGASQLNVTCETTNSLPSTKPLLLSKSAGASFTINVGTITTNPACFEYSIRN